MKLKLIVSLLTVVGLSACSTAMEDQRCSNYQDFKWGQNCTFRDKSNDDSTKFTKYESKQNDTKSADSVSNSTDISSPTQPVEPEEPTPPEPSPVEDDSAEI